jgi:hypothetical protein
MTDDERPDRANQMSEAQRVAAAVIRRESRRIRSLAVLSILLWVVAMLLIVTMELPAMAKAKYALQRINQPSPTGQPMTAEEVGKLLGQMVGGAIVLAAVATMMAMLAGLLASICTVVLALTIRRVTLRQVNEGLAQISAQLRELKGPPV